MTRSLVPLSVLAVLLLQAATASPLEAVEVLERPRLGEDRTEAVTLLLPGGQLPVEPWSGMTDEDRELCWALAARGLLIQRTAWCGYVLIVPRGTAERFLPMFARMSTTELAPDTGLWARTLDLRPAPGEPVIIAFRDSTASSGVPAIPIRVSAWLESGEDTLLVPGPWANDVFLLTGERDGEPVEGLGAGFWRGVGHEVIPGAFRSAPAIVTTTLSGTPSDLFGLSAGITHWDSIYAIGYASVFSAIDSLIEAVHPSGPDCVGKLVWMRGLGYGDTLSPWTSFPLPPPGAHSPISVAAPEELTGPGLVAAPPPDFAGRLIGRASCEGLDPDEELVAACLLERMIASSSLFREHPGLGIMVMAEGDSLAFFLTGEAGAAGSPVMEMSSIWSALGPTLLARPGENLLENAAVRASVLSGRPVEAPDAHGMLMNLAGMAGF
ncbi:hypothetical protein JW921_06360 [Candidatus Fermentibacterales bacterium]|nr:hypothetical protein [Candidatus Fermentibacterales bacterium]